ncbi:hypothetical protein ACFPVT_04810 [Corynebacterium choanae]|uniref:Polysaccharide biosynthesis protein n=1 Tax=Corynebacterium choanae TaxID=1862358 RepID=A0A3G6J8Y5_9CORY|nr:hypothetical protein [Corynebacterium choanae]AZA14527.1 hypothetical protein CCHOA_10740 [Corynebacterium choanae]
MRALSVATVVAALSGFFILFAATWTLSATDASVFLAYWGLFFALTGCIDGVMQETTRAVSAKESKPGFQRARHGARPILVGAGIGLVIAAVVLVTAPLWMGAMTGDFVTGATMLFAAGLASYAVQAVVAGAVSGTKAWLPFAWLVAVDSLIRVVVVVAAWWAGWGVHVFFIATVIGAFTWLGLVAGSPATRAALRRRADVTVPMFLRQTVTAMAATGATALLITGFPAFMKATADESIIVLPSSVAGGEHTVTLAALMLAVMLTRAPILVPLQRFQPALIVRFVEGQQVRRVLLKPALILGAVTAVGAAAAWLVGPWILRLVFAPEMFVPGAVLAMLTIAAGATGMVMITGCFALATGQHRRYVAGWAVASAVAFGCLALPINLVATTVLALITGPVAGIATHLLALPSPRHTKSRFTPAGQQAQPAP